VTGMCVYNDVIITPFMRQRGWIAGTPADADVEPLLDDAEAPDSVEPPAPDTGDAPGEAADAEAPRPEPQTVT